MKNETCNTCRYWRVGQGNEPTPGICDAMDIVGPGTSNNEPAVLLRVGEGRVELCTRPEFTCGMWDARELGQPKTGPLE